MQNNARGRSYSTGHCFTPNCTTGAVTEQGDHRLSPDRQLEKNVIEHSIGEEKDKVLLFHLLFLIDQST